MKKERDKFYLITGILEMLLGILVFFRNSYILGIIIFLIGILIIVKGYLNWIKFSFVNYFKKR
ncbi:MAG: hypothetical protein Q8O84_04165 [Nanoarchaeota archaeon]|nr:hypothetical protein [Nanoarchaeota archaeon]